MGGSSLPLYKTVRSTQAKMADASAFTDIKNITLRKAPFSNLCNHIVKDKIEKHGLRFGCNVRETLLEASEAHLKAICVKANRLCEHSKRKAVDASDLDLAWNIDTPVTVEDTYVRSKKTPTIAKAVMRRLFIESGMKRVRSDCYPKAQEILDAFLLEVLESCNALVQSRRTKTSKDVKSPTVTAADVSFALNSINAKVYGVASAKR